MIRIAITQAAFNAIAATLQLGSVELRESTSTSGANDTFGPPNVVDRLKAQRRLGESYSDVILRLASAS